ncbi:YhjD/YihY/BrkB family envelope integrity protein [Geobacter sp. DSM 9736]|uniref:YhjD/YihY/BrkB family envelope integrity protein n=1 Tax=Geobacter sp. DSM 9736 TaxID=1277350 RepID=UPI001E2A38BE|nr:YhjD/YihY/BrkB family envelope integrity protein [Geobacter sp. DSM 9736]
MKRKAVKYLQILAMVIRNFWDDQCLLRASALSFTSILSLVPFFALTFAVLKGLGVHNKVEPLILAQVTGGYDEILDKVVTYINNTNMTSLGAIGLVTLIITVVSLLSSIEEAFNVIWGVRETRSLYRRFADYLSVVVSAPLLLLAATSITTTLKSQELVQWLLSTSYIGEVLLFGFQLIPYVSVWVALIFVYTFIPNTNVRLKSAIIGGILAGTLWQGMQWAYITFQFGVAKYNAIYGTLALVPIFMFWIYTSWLIVLFGVEVVCAHQNIRTFRREIHSPTTSQSLKELLALSILQTVTTAFYSGQQTWTTERLAEHLDAPVRTVRDLLAQLVEARYLAPVKGHPSSYLPARDPATIAVAEILTTLRDRSGKTETLHVGMEVRQLRDLLTRIDNAVADSLHGMTLAEMVRSPAAPETRGEAERSASARTSVDVDKDG